MATLKNAYFCGIISQLIWLESLAVAFKIRAEDPSLEDAYLWYSLCSKFNGIFMIHQEWFPQRVFWWFQTQERHKKMSNVFRLENIVFMGQLRRISCLRHIGCSFFQVRWELEFPEALPGLCSKAWKVGFLDCQMIHTYLISVMRKVDNRKAARKSKQALYQKGADLRAGQERLLRDTVAHSRFGHYFCSKLQMACLVDPGASFDTPGTSGGGSI